MTPLSESQVLHRETDYTLLSQYMSREWQTLIFVQESPGKPDSDRTHETIIIYQFLFKKLQRNMLQCITAQRQPWACVYGVHHSLRLMFVWPMGVSTVRE